MGSDRSLCKPQYAGHLGKVVIVVIIMTASEHYLNDMCSRHLEVSVRS